MDIVSIIIEHLFGHAKHDVFSWFDALKVAFYYTYERGAFLKLLPFIFYNAVFSRSIYVASKFDIDTVDWSESLCLKRYSVDKGDVINKTQNLN